MDVDEQTGWWWLPGREDRKIPGVLTFDPERGGKLTLIGGLVEVEEVATAVTRNGETSIAIGEDEIEAAGTYDRILGIADCKPVTLEQCIEIRRSGGMFAETTKQIIRVGRILHGAQFESAGTGGDGLQVGLDWLTEWTQRSGITGSVKLKEGQEPLYTMEGRRLPTEWIELDGGGRLGLRHSIRAEMDVTAPALEQAFKFELDYPDVRTADELIDIASDLQDLVSIGTGRAAAFQRVDIFHPDVYQETPASRWHKPIMVHTQWTAEDAERSGRWSAMRRISA
jgi:ApeA-like protein